MSVATETAPPLLRRLLRPRLGRRIGWPVAGLSGVIILGELASTGFRPLGFSLAAAVTNGLQTGAIYSLVALGIALVYRSTKVINFAQGELGTVPALFVMLALVGFDRSADIIDLGAVSKPAFIGFTLLAILLGAAIAVAVNVGIVQQLAQASPVTSLVATAGVSVLFTAAELKYFEARPRPFPRFIDGAPTGFQVGPFCFSQIDGGSCLGSDGRFAVGGLVVPWNTVLVLALLLVVSLLLAAFFRSAAGTAMLATAQDGFAAELYGVSSRAMSTLAWAAAGGFGALAGVLAAGVSTQITPGFMTGRFLVAGLVAAVLGGITSMVGAVVGGLVVGVVFSLANSIVLELGANSVVPGPPFLATFLVLVVVLLVRPRGLFGKEA